MFPEAVESLIGHTAIILDHIERGHQALVIGLNGIRGNFFSFRQVGDLCQVYFKTEDPTPAATFHVDASYHTTRQGGRHSTVYFNQV